jgi:hypothetical protein
MTSPSKPAARPASVDGVVNQVEQTGRDVLPRPAMGPGRHSCLDAGSIPVIRPTTFGMAMFGMALCSRLWRPSELSTHRQDHAVGTRY